MDEEHEKRYCDEQQRVSNTEYQPTKCRITKPPPPKPATNPLQFIKVSPPPLFQKAYEQIRKVEEIKKEKKEVLEDAEDWQQNLDNWKSSRRKRQEHLIERVVEAKKFETVNAEDRRRKSKTFSEMMEERSRGRHKLHIPILNVDDSNDLSDLGISNSSTSRSDDNAESSTTEICQKDAEIIMSSKTVPTKTSVSTADAVTNGNDLVWSSGSCDVQVERNGTAPIVNGTNGSASPIELQNHEPVSKSKALDDPIPQQYSANGMDTDISLVQSATTNHIDKNGFSDYQDSDHCSGSNNDDHRPTERIDENSREQSSSPELILYSKQLTKFSMELDDMLLENNNRKIINSNNLLYQNVSNVASPPSRLNQSDGSASTLIDDRDVIMNIMNDLHLPLAPSTLTEPPKKPPPPPPVEPNVKRLNSTKRIKRELYMKRSTFLGLPTDHSNTMLDEPVHNNDIQQNTNQSHQSNTTNQHPSNSQKPLPIPATLRANKIPTPISNLLSSQRHSMDHMLDIWPHANTIPQRMSTEYHRTSLPDVPNACYDSNNNNDPYTRKSMPNINTMAQNGKVVTTAETGYRGHSPPQILAASWRQPDRQFQLPLHQTVSQRPLLHKPQVPPPPPPSSTPCNRDSNKVIALPPSMPVSIAKYKLRDYNQHWLFQEAELRRLADASNMANMKRQAARAKSNKHLPEVVAQSLVQRNINHNDNTCSTDWKSPPTHQQWTTDQTSAMGDERKRDTIVAGTQKSAIPDAASCNNNHNNSITTATNSNDRMLSVSGKKKCSFCGKELGRGAAMIIESLTLFYHMECFKCYVCNVQLSDGLSGTDVRVRNQKLHCHNCYSSDDGIKLSCV